MAKRGKRQGRSQARSMASRTPAGTSAADGRTTGAPEATVVPSQAGRTCFCPRAVRCAAARDWMTGSGGPEPRRAGRREAREDPGDSRAAGHVWGRRGLQRRARQNRGRADILAPRRLAEWSRPRPLDPSGAIPGIRQRKADGRPGLTHGSQQGRSRSRRQEASLSGAVVDAAGCRPPTERPRGTRPWRWHPGAAVLPSRPGDPLVLPRPTAQGVQLHMNEDQLMAVGAH